MAFILVQRISSAFVPLLVKQLDRTTKFQVIAGEEGHVLRYGEVIVAPAEDYLSIDPSNRLTMEPATQDGRLSSVDSLMNVVARRYGPYAGAIIFSGMGSDGIVGCHAIVQNGGAVWTQDADTCVIGTMPDHVRNACDVSLTAAPEILAEQLVEKLGSEVALEVNEVVG